MSGYILAIIFALAASLSWGLNSFVLKMGAANDGPMLALIIRALISFPLLLLITLLFRTRTALLIYFEPMTFVLLILLVASIVVGDGLFIYALRDYSVNLILPIASVYPLITTLILLMTGEEIITPAIMAGTILVVIGISIVTSRGTFVNGFPLAALLLGLGVALGWGSSVYFAKLILDLDGTESFGLMTFRTFFIGLSAFVILLQSTQEKENLMKKS